MTCDCTEPWSTRSTSRHKFLMKIPWQHSSIDTHLITEGFTSSTRGYGWMVCISLCVIICESTTPTPTRQQHHKTDHMYHSRSGLSENPWVNVRTTLGFRASLNPFASYYTDNPFDHLPPVSVRPGLPNTLSQPLKALNVGDSSPRDKLCPCLPMKVWSRRMSSLG